MKKLQTDDEQEKSREFLNELQELLKKHNMLDDEKVRLEVVAGPLKFVSPKNGKCPKGCREIFAEVVKDDGSRRIEVVGCDC